MATKDLKGLTLSITVSDPWEFVTEHGSGPLVATVLERTLNAEAPEGNAVLLKLHAPINHAGTICEYFVAAERTSGDRLSDLLRDRTVNCNLTRISEERALAARPFDLSWRRGGVALLASLRTARQDPQTVNRMDGDEDQAVSRFRSLFPSVAADGTAKWRYDRSPYFGDYAVSATYGNVEIRLVHERGLDSVEVRPSRREEWFDLALLKALLTGGDAAVGATAEELGSFFEERSVDILAALDSRQWNLTEVRLKSLEEESARRRFGSYKEKK